MARKKFLLLGGMTLTAYWSGIRDHFGAKVADFISQAFRVDSPQMLATMVQSKRAPHHGSVFRTPVAGGRKVDHSGAAHILQYEADLAGCDTTAAPIADFFELHAAGQMQIAKKWLSELDDADVVGLSTTFITNQQHFLRMCQLIKERGKTLVVGGPLVERLHPQVLRDAAFDFGLKYEAEGRFRYLLEQALGPRPDSQVLHTLPGAVWPCNGVIHHAAAPFATVDLNAWKLYPSQELVRKRGGSQNYESVRGCPYRCEFCDYPFLLGMKKARFKSAETIHEEWTRLRDLGVNHIMVVDSVFTVPKKRMLRLFDLMQASGLAQEMRWTCWARTPELADPDFTAAMKEAGCSHVAMGTESGSQVILNAMHKQATVEDNRRAVRNCRDVKISSQISVLLGFPGESETTVAETEAFLYEQVSEVAGIYVWLPLDYAGNQAPIMQPDRIEQYQCEFDDHPKPFDVQFWGESISVVPERGFRHATMTSEEAYHHAARLSEAMRYDRIACHENSFTPYADLLRPPHEICEVLEYEQRRCFYAGFKSLFIDYLQGRALCPPAIDAWLDSCGLTASGLTARHAA